MKDVLVLLHFLLGQILVLTISRLPAVAVTVIGAAAVNVAISRRRAGIFRLALAVAVLTVPVLLGQLFFLAPTATVDPSVLLRDWGVYASRLLAAALIARVYLISRGTSGIQRGLAGVTRFLPRRVAQTIALVAGSALFLVPVVTVYLRRTLQIASIRFRSGGKMSIRKRSRALGATLIHLSLLPQRRAEGMVIRGMVE